MCPTELQTPSQIKGHAVVESLSSKTLHISVIGQFFKPYKSKTGILVAMGIHLNITLWVEEFLKSRTFRMKSDGHLLSEGIINSGASHGSVLGQLMFLILSNDLVNELTRSRLFFAGDIKLTASRRKHHGLRSSIQHGIIWPNSLDLPLNASKSHHLSIGGPADLRLALSEKAEEKALLKCEHSVNSAFTPSSNVLAAANEARGMLYFIKRSSTRPTGEI